MELKRGRWLETLLRYLSSAGWWQEPGRHDDRELLGRYDGRTRWMMAGIVISAALLLMFALKSTSCDMAWAQAMGGGPGSTQDQWKQNRPRDTLSLCQGNHNNSEGVKVCDK